VWNRQRTDRDNIDRPPLVSEEQFVRVQAVHTASTPANGVPRSYVLAGAVNGGVGTERGAILAMSRVSACGVRRPE
jgi:hypothetical protein